jgi:Flp pilus assembly protein CpaB
MLKLTDVPEALVPHGTFTSTESVVGRVNSRTLISGMCVSEALLAPPGTPPGLTMKIPEGMRAVAVEVDEFSSVAGFIRPGSRVDVVALLKSTTRGRKDNISRTVLQDIEVAAVGQEMGDDSGTGATVTRSVTLLVKPKEAPLLHLAATKGKIRLALRNKDDASAAGGGYASENALRSGEDQQADEDRAPRGRGNWLGQVAAGMLESGLRNSRQGPPHGTQAAARPRGWTVTVNQGQETETFHFASATSWQRLSPAEIVRTAHKVNEPGMVGRYSWGGDQDWQEGDPDGEAGTEPDRPSD